MESSFLLPVTPVNYETWERLTCIPQASWSSCINYFYPWLYSFLYSSVSVLWSSRFSLLLVCDPETVNLSHSVSHLLHSFLRSPPLSHPSTPLLSRYLKCVHVGPTDTLMTPLKGKCYYSGLRPRSGRKLHRWPGHGGWDVDPSWSNTNLILFPTGHASWLISSNGLQMNKVQMSTNWGFQY